VWGIDGSDRQISAAALQQVSTGYEDKSLEICLYFVVYASFCDKLRINRAFIPCAQKPTSAPRVAKN